MEFIQENIGSILTVLALVVGLVYQFIFKKKINVKDLEKKMLLIWGVVNNDKTILQKEITDTALTKAKELATKQLSMEEYKYLCRIGSIAEKNPKKVTTGDKVKAGIGDVISNSAVTLGTNLLANLIKKI